MCISARLPPHPAREATACAASMPPNVPYASYQLIGTWCSYMAPGFRFVLWSSHFRAGAVGEASRLADIAAKNTSTRLVRWRGANGIATISISCQIFLLTSDHLTKVLRRLRIPISTSLAPASTPCARPSP